MTTPQYFLTEEPPERVLDLRWTAWSHRVKPSLRLIGTWRLDTWESCMVVVSDRIPLERTIPCIVTQSEAWRWDEDHGDVIWAAHRAVEFAQVMPHLNWQNQSDVIALLDAIRGRIDELVLQTPAPPRARRTIGHINVRDADGVIIAQEDAKTDV